MSKEKIKHNYKCQNCGEIATINIQCGYSNNPDGNGNCQKYEIENDGNFILVDEWGEEDQPDADDFLCDRCFKEGNF